MVNASVDSLECPVCDERGWHEKVVGENTCGPVYENWSCPYCMLGVFRAAYFSLEF